MASVFFKFLQFIPCLMAVHVLSWWSLSPHFLTTSACPCLVYVHENGPGSSNIFKHVLNSEYLIKERAWEVLTQTLFQVPVSYVWELFDWPGCKDGRKNWCCDRQSLSQRILKKEAQAGGSSSPGQQLPIFWKCWATDPATLPVINAAAHLSRSGDKTFWAVPTPLRRTSFLYMRDASQHRVSSEFH